MIGANQNTPLGDVLLPALEDDNVSADDAAEPGEEAVRQIQAHLHDVEVVRRRLLEVVEELGSAATEKVAAVRELVALLAHRVQVLADA